MSVHVIGEDYYCQRVGAALVSLLCRDPHSTPSIEAALGELSRCFEADHVTVVQIEPVGEHMTVVAEAGLAQGRSPHRYRQPLSKGVIGKCARTACPQLVNDTRLSPDYAVIHKNHTRTEWCFPLLRGKRVLGVLDLQSATAEAFSPQMLPAFELSAALLALLMELSYLECTAEDRDRTLSAVLDATDSALIMVDESGLIRNVNERFAALFGLEKAQLVGRPYQASLLPLQDRFRDPRAFGEQIAQLGVGNRLGVRTELEMKSPKGCYRVFTAPVHRRQGEESGVLQTYVDVTTLHETQQELELLVQAGYLLKAHTDLSPMVHELGGLLSGRYRLASMALMAEHTQEQVCWNSLRAPGLGEGLLSRLRRPVEESVEPLLWEQGRAVENEEKDLSRFLQGHEVASLMAFPLWVEGRRLGTWILASHQRGTFQAGARVVLASIAAHLSAALDSIRLHKQTESLYESSIWVLAATVDARDAYTMSHSVNVAHYAKMIAQAMRLTPEQVQRIEHAGLVHDLGKVGIPDDVLNKRGPLNALERNLMMNHPAAGARILENSGALAHLAPLVRCHHEWHQGDGYPEGLSGVDIPLGASILAVADAFDSMTSFRVYRPALPLDEVMRELERCTPVQFHPDVVKAFFHLIAQAREEKQTWMQSVCERKGMQRWSRNQPVTLSGQAREADGNSEVGLLLHISSDTVARLKDDALIRRVAELLESEMEVKSATLLEK